MSNTEASENPEAPARDCEDLAVVSALVEQSDVPCDCVVGDDESPGLEPHHIETGIFRVDHPWREMFWSSARVTRLIRRVDPILADEKVTRAIRSVSPKRVPEAILAWLALKETQDLTDGPVLLPAG